ncbi:MAG: SDR family oxidoreductase, partial [Lachnospiraceae bacterium]|nr:SDR family oxidoreductase [Lachnospiraceae bacterium]
KPTHIKENTRAEVFCCAADCNDEAAVEEMSKKVAEALGGIDILVNSQGVNKKFSALDHPTAEWDEMFNANVKSIMLTCKYFGRMMVEQRYGRIINVSSIGAVRAKMSDISVCYGATKGAVDAYSLNLAAGWSQYGITVNCIGPIMTETEMMKPIFEKNPELRDGTAARVPAGRIGLPEDCAGIALFFASDASAFVSGQRVYADGGLMTLQ